MNNDQPTINRKDVLVRIVRMSFHPDKAADFLQIFQQAKSKIRNFEGCHHLELMQDPQDPHIYMTYSHWTNEDALEHYRHSELFKTTWAKTKVLFNDKPVAFSAKAVSSEQ
ncbi:putative quinol monooxygenase [Algivirga pacifica]|uniref:Antibiotic biosynthesis monooxygenase n=1 Tax=Algivirga pacifica TaxID=1162670 RepID=A0ABP9D016_9BACT